jgi:hypothetical protein
VPNLMSILHYLGRTKGSVQARGTPLRNEASFYDELLF